MNNLNELKSDWIESREVTYTQLCDTSEAIVDCAANGSSTSLMQISIYHQQQRTAILVLKAKTFLLEMIEDVSEADGTIQDLLDGMNKHLQDVICSSGGYDKEYLEEVAWKCREVTEKLSTEPFHEDLLSL